jgi:hypothetical protein
LTSRVRRPPRGTARRSSEACRRSTCGALPSDSVTHDDAHTVQRMDVDSRVASMTLDFVLLHDGHSRLRMELTCGERVPPAVEADADRKRGATTDRDDHEGRVPHFTGGFSRH